MKEEVEKEHPDRQITVEFLPLDLASFQSVKEFTVAFCEKNLPLHFLINNAAIFAVPLSELWHELHCCGSSKCYLHHYHYYNFLILVQVGKITRFGGLRPRCVYH